MNTYFPTPSECPSRAIFPGVQTTTWWTDNLMLSLATLEPHAIVERHQHPHEQIGMVLEGRARFQIGDEEKELGPGDRFRIPSNVPHRVVVLGERATIMDAFTPVRREYQ